MEWREASCGLTLWRCGMRSDDWLASWDLDELMAVLKIAFCAGMFIAAIAWTMFL